MEGMPRGWLAVRATCGLTYKISKFNRDLIQAAHSVAED